jgi:hypothetical protein
MRVAHKIELVREIRRLRIVLKTFKWLLEDAKAPAMTGNLK